MGEQDPRRRAMRVLIVDDDPLFRLGVAAALAGDDQLEFILSEAGDGEAALALIASEEPAVVLLSRSGVVNIDASRGLRAARGRRRRGHRASSPPPQFWKNAVSGLCLSRSPPSG